jgi:hypothetical protein
LAKQFPVAPIGDDGKALEAPTRDANTLRHFFTTKHPAPAKESQKHLGVGADGRQRIGKTAGRPVVRTRNLPI